MKTRLLLFLFGSALALSTPAETNAPPAFRLAGKVVDSEGRPVAGATVERYEFGPVAPFPREGMELKQRATTDATGAFEFQFARASTLLLARKPGLAPAWNDLWNPERDLPEQRLVLTTPSTLSGVVMNEADQPVSDAEVFVALAFREIPLENGVRRFATLSAKLARECFSTRTSADGRFRIKGFPTNALVALDVRTPGKVLRELSGGYASPDALPYRAGQEDIKLVVEPAGGIEGKIVMSDSSQPLPIARLWLQPGGPGFSGLGDPAQSGADGAFRLGDIAAGAYRVRATFGTNAVPDWVAEPIPVSVESGQTTRGVQVLATRGGFLEVAVLGKKDRKALAQVNVTAFRESFYASAASGSNGAAFLRLPPGEYRVSASRENSLAENTTATVEAGKTNRVEIELAPPSKVTGIVRRPDGQPASGLEVRLIGSYGLDRSGLKTDSEGRFEMEWNPRSNGMGDRTSCLLVRDAERNLAVAQDLDEDTGSLELKLSPGLTLAGRVESDGKPITNATATLVFWTGRSAMHLTGLSRGTNTSGRFEIPALPPGRKYGVVVSAPGYGQKAVYDVGAAAAAGRFELETIELALANRKLAGQVLDADDKPVAGANVHLNGEGQPTGSARTDRDGRFSFDSVCEGSVRLFASARNLNGNIVAEGGDTNVILRLEASSRTTISNAKAHKLKGIVTDSGGKPVAGAQVAVFPFDASRWSKTGTNGAYNLTWSLQPWQSQSANALLVVRDTARNLAAVADLSEETTNLDVQLKPALTFTGRVEDPDGAPLASAQVGVWLKTGNSYNQLDEQLAATDTQGRFEIKSLPVEAHYRVFAKANGRGRSQQEVQTDTETNRMELTPFVLKLADRILAGQVVNQNDKPVSGANVRLSGEDQPDGNATTDSKGRFHLQVCAGKVQIFASSQSSFANTVAEAGDTNVIIQLGSAGSVGRSSPMRASLKGQPLPDLTALSLATNAAPAGQRLLLCLFDLEQRPSRRLVRLLAEQHDALKQKGLTVLAVQAAVTTAESLQTWKDGNPVPFPVGRVPEKSDKTRWVSSVESLPWLILTDAERRVVAEGFALDELEAQLKAPAK